MSVVATTHSFCTMEGMVWLGPLEGICMSAFRYHVVVLCANLCMNEVERAKNRVQSSGWGEGEKLLP